MIVLIATRRTTGRMRDCIHPVVKELNDRRTDYWTVTVPFMFIAACGVHW